MSGGYFDHRSFHYMMMNFALDVESEIQRNELKLSNETLETLRQCVAEFRKSFLLVKHVDYLFAGDHTEESFMQAINDMREF